MKMQILRKIEGYGFYEDYSIDLTTQETKFRFVENGKYGEFTLHPSNINFLTYISVMCKKLKDLYF